MATCSTCGNDLGTSGRCPFCGAAQVGCATRKRSAARIVTVNLKQNRPVVDEAIAHLDREIAAARMGGVRLIRLIHGWGSSGAGGAIRDAVRRHLESLRRARRIQAFAPGDEFSEETNRGRELLRAYPALRSSLRTDRENPGITFVEV